MEITEKTLVERLTKMIAVQNNDQDWALLTENLREKGVECSLIIPVLDVLLGFDSIFDISYEETSKVVNGQRFDFLLDRKIIIEAKRLEENLNDHVSQISQYLVDNDLEYGILTNGFDYWFLLKKTYIERVANEGNEIESLSKDQKVIVVMKISIDPFERGSCESFAKIMKMFSKDQYDDSFRKIAQYARSIITFTKKRGVTLHKEKDINEYLQKNIEEAISYDKGSFFEELRSGIMKEGQELIYEDEIVRIVVILQKNGMVKYPSKGLSVKDFNKMRETREYEPLIDLLSQKWDYQENTYNDYKDIFRKITGKKSIHKKYQFSKIE